MARKPRGMSTAEYGLVLAAIAIVAYGSYLMLGSGVSSLANGVDSILTMASHGARVAQSTPTP
jgi:Flp pilus assembly pilin Flp